MGLFSSAKKAVSKATKTVTGSIKKISKGDIKGGIGDLSEGAATMGLDIATGGNKKLVDAYSGGLLSSAEGAARGNSTDLTRLGIVGGATVLGGPAAGFALNQVMARGGSEQEILTGLASAGGYGGLATAIDYAGNAVSYSNKPSPAPAALRAQDPGISYAPSGGGGSDTTKYLMIGGGAFAILISILFFVSMRRK